MTVFVKNRGNPKRTEISPPFGIGDENPARDTNLVAQTKELLKDDKKQLPIDDCQGLHTIGPR